MHHPITIYGNVYLCGTALGHRHGFQWHLGPVRLTRKDRMDLELTLTDEQECDVEALAPKTAAGHPAQLDGPVTFTLLSGDCTLVPVGTQRCTIQSGTAGTESVIEASADADLGAGVVTITDQITVHVVSAMAADLGLVADAPRLKAVP
jgi:hypothetical protein